MKYVVFSSRKQSKTLVENDLSVFFLFTGNKQWHKQLAFCDPIVTCLWQSGQINEMGWNEMMLHWSCVLIIQTTGITAAIIMAH